MEQITKEELEQRIALLKKFRELLEKQRAKFREYLSVLEKQETSITTENPETCPHGRPISKFFEHKELAKFFQRNM